MMNQLNLALLALLEGVKSFFEMRLWGPLVLLVAAQLVLVLALVSWHQPGLVTVMAPLIRAMTGEVGLHYPQFYLALSSIFSLTSPVVNFFLGAYLWGVAVVLVANHFESTGQRPWGLARARYGHLLVAEVPAIVLLTVFYAASRSLLGMDLGGNKLRAVLYGLPMVFVFFQSAFLMAPMYVLFDRLDGARALGRSIAFWRRNIPALFIIMIVPQALHFPSQWVFRHNVSVVSRFSPETLGFVLAGDVVFYLFTYFLLVVAATVTYFARRRAV